MSDPVVDAVDRLWSQRFPDLPRLETVDDGRGVAEPWAIGAREALGPIRELHAPDAARIRGRGRGYSLTGGRPIVEGDRIRLFCAECAEYGTSDMEPWPCATAKLAYSEAEIERIVLGAESKLI